LETVAWSIAYSVSKHPIFALSGANRYLAVKPVEVEDRLVTRLVANAVAQHRRQAASNLTITVASIEIEALEVAVWITHSVSNHVGLAAAQRHCLLAIPTIKVVLCVIALIITDSIPNP
jgi:hypothetical protein